MYQTISQAIEYVQHNAHPHLHPQRSVTQMAEAIGCSPASLEQAFTNWTGQSPTQMLQYFSLDFLNNQAQKTAVPLPLFSTIDGARSKAQVQTYESFIQLKGMSPSQFRRDGRGLALTYASYDSIYGRVLLAHSQKGLCRLSFLEGDEIQAVEALKTAFPKACWTEKEHPQDPAILEALENPLKVTQPISVHVKGTPFQLEVWKALLKLSPDRWTSYGQITHDIQHDKKAARAVGSAVGANPIAVLIPCHRVLRADGGIGGYYWGTTKKKAILMREFGLLNAMH